MPLPRHKFPLRVRHAGTDPVHAVRRHPAKGHRTACLTWLDPEHPHIWCAEDAEVTCTECIERLAPTAHAAEIPGSAGTLQERLAEVIENEVPSDFGDLLGRRIAETVENWRQEAEERIRLSVDEVLVDLAPDATRSTVARDLTQKVLRSMDVGNGITDEGVEG